MKPAVILCQPEIGALRVAALSVLDRLVITLHRAGCTSIQVVCAGALPSLKRSRELGLQPKVLPHLPEINRPTLVAECGLVVQVGDVKRVMDVQARLVRSDGQPLPLGWVGSFSGELKETLSRLPQVTALGAAEQVKDDVSAREAGRRLWTGLANPADGVVDTYFNRPLGRFLAKVLIHAPVTPNQVSVASMVIGLGAAVMFALGTYPAGVIGAILFQLAALVDCVDGDIARILFKETPWGKWLDLGGDQVVHMALFGAIAFGLARQDAAVPVLWLGTSAVLGSLTAFLVVVRAMRRPEEERRPALQKVMDALATRDFSVLVLALAVAGRLEWLLWLAGTAVHLFWMTALILQIPSRAPAGKGGRGAE